ncbi:hypothetical protein BD410DRAFT_754176 [Rickenella mellea]|uniref:Nucleolar pre-ribosomal-associated protein 1 n=1 Tax=Rickenella mellea TaxID=50990 RepID=A0A4Y7PSY1_9AGAM|nr:hypothetical protein BD410DRAFT_754176 [Rickenella mellea]
MVLSKPEKKVNASREPKPAQHKFSSGREIRESFRNNDGVALTNALSAFRNQITVKSYEGTIGTQDERLLLIKEWLELSPGAEEVFNLITRGTQPAIEILAISTLACLLTLLSSQFIYQALGQPIIQKLLSSQWMRTLEMHLSGSRTDQALMTMKLLNSISEFAGGKERKALLQAFTWDSKVMNKLLFMRRKGKNASDNQDVLTKPGENLAPLSYIRTLTIMFILSFVAPSASTYVKVTFLEQHRDLFTGVFKGINIDPYSVTRTILETSWTGIWQDLKIKRTLKVGLFNESTLQQILKLYDRASSEGSNPEHVPADLAHHFMLAICTHRGTGVCFADHGWYPRAGDDPDPEEGGREHSSRSRVGKVYNKILANLLRTLKVNEDSRQQELALKILSSCPELVAGYWQAGMLTLEPRLSSKWLANVAFFGSVISLPVPADAFFLPSTVPSSSNSAALYQPSPPPLATIMENILPSLHLKTHFTKGLQSSSALVQHGTAVALTKCLCKFEEVVDRFRTIRNALEEDESNGQWAKRINEVEQEVRKRLPDFQVIVAFSQQKPTVLPESSSTPASISTQMAKTLLLSEVAQRLLWLYHRCVPTLVAEARFDAGKALQTFVDQLDERAESGAETISVADLERLRQLHVLRMLRESDQFSWSGKSASSHSNIYVLLKLYIKTSSAAVRTALTSLLSHALSDSLLFQHHPEELRLWLDCLPHTIRAAGAESPDGAPLTDEGESVVTFLDDCMQRCGKTPYRYIDDLSALYRPPDVLAQETMDVDSSTVKDLAMFDTSEYEASPLIMAVLEQLSAKLKNQLLSPSDTLALATYIRKLLVKLLAKQSSTYFLNAALSRLENIFDVKGLFSSYPIVRKAIERELDHLKASIALTVDPDNRGFSASAANGIVQNFIAQAEGVSIPETQTQRKIIVYDLVDRVRLLDGPLHLNDVKGLAAVINRIYSPALPDFCEHLNPRTGFVFDILKSSVNNTTSIPFKLVLLHTSSANLRSKDGMDQLVAALKAHQFDLLSSKLSFGLLCHRMQNAQPADLPSILSLVNAFAAHTLSCLSAADAELFKSFAVGQNYLSKQLFREDGPALPELDQLVQLLLDPEVAADKVMAADVCNHWTTELENAFIKPTNVSVARASSWIKFMDDDQILGILARLLPLVELQDSKPRLHDSWSVIEESFKALQRMQYSKSSLWLQRHVVDLLSLRRMFPQSEVLESVITAGVNSGIPIGHDGFTLPSELATLPSVISSAQSRWSLRLAPLPGDLELRTFLEEDTWSESQSKAVSGLLYRSTSARQTFIAWLNEADQVSKVGIHRIVEPLHAFMTSGAEVVSGSPSLHGPIEGLFKACVQELFDAKTSADEKIKFSSCVLLFLKRSSGDASYSKTLLEHIASQRPDVIIPELLDIGLSLSRLGHPDTNDILQATIDHALQWAVRQLSDVTPISDLGRRVFRSLEELITRRKQVTPHFAEPVIIAGIRNHLLNDVVMKVIVALVANASLKPVNLNRHLQSVLQHPDLFRINPASESPSRRTVINLLHTMFHQHPSNTCQPTHIQPLLRLYRGSLSPSDRQLLAIFHLFETQRKASMTSIFAHWSSSESTVSQTCLDAVTSLDATIILRTCLAFPVRRPLDVAKVHGSEERPTDSQIYDPVFVLLLFAQAMLDGPPKSALGWVELFRTNVLSLIVRVLSSADASMRRLALLQVSSLWSLLKNADLQEKDHLTYVLNLLRDLLPAPTDLPPPRLPSYTTLVLAHALRGIFYPSNFMYPHTARFLLQRPEMDPHDVPLLYGMLYSSSDDWRKERGWIVKFLGDGLDGAEDWRVFRRRHTWDLVASMFQSTRTDRALRHGVLEVLATLTSNAHATSSLILKSALIQWMEMQLSTVLVDECTAWTKIIENILVYADAQKLERATAGEWRAGLSRSLGRLLHGDDIDSLRLFSRVLLRLALLPFPPPRSISLTLQSAVHALEAFEAKSDLPIPSALHFFPDSAAEEGNASQPPHGSYGLHQVTSTKGDDDLLRAWGDCVERLWQVAMVCNEKDAAWDALSCRLLVWRALVGEGGTEVGEWARKEVVRCLGAGA